jgi:NAD(P)-dependent dehydrogenase (short-subunit alcohol dehydrogenase family)
VSSDLDVLVEEVGFNLKSTITVIREFTPLVRKSEAKRIAVISSILGSIELGQGFNGLANAYSISKAALNMCVQADEWDSSCFPSEPLGSRCLVDRLVTL